MVSTDQKVEDFIDALNAYEAETEVIRGDEKHGPWAAGARNIFEDLVWGNILVDEDATEAVTGSDEIHLITGEVIAYNSGRWS